MSSQDRGAAVGFPPPFVFIGLLLTGPLVERFVAVPPLGLPWLLGAAVAIVGLALIGAAIGLFRQRGENPEPWTPTNGIVDTGLYAYTRNPMYLGMAMAHLGLAIVLGSLVSLVLLPVAILIIQTQVIAREERYLEAKFGAAYRDYKTRVRRWI
ncbi:MAG: isoprenylcysteine carboxyl methyltransferase [Sphingobium sp.]|nr:isoprenylcysteine carboxyl methyltransferase [Sphingobium sp.]